MIAINQYKIIKIHKEFEKDIKEQSKNALTKLKKHKNLNLNCSEKKYLKQVIVLFKSSSIITLTPEDLETLKLIIGIAPFSDYKNSKGNFINKISPFIINALSYKKLRTSFYPKYFNKTRIKACVYCNSQLTITVIKKGGEDYSAKFDVDHYHPKSKYPFMSISLFNLYPVCSSCNRLKGKKTISFDLYTEDIEKTKKSNFTFKLDPYHKAKYLTNKKPNVIKTKFITDNDKYKSTFHIEEIYNTQNDLVEELILKSLVYNREYKILLNRSFKHLSLHSNYYKRLLLGNYAETHEIHKRPMSKFMQDIARELGVIE